MRDIQSGFPLIRAKFRGGRLLDIASTRRVSGGNRDGIGMESGVHPQGAASFHPHPILGAILSRNSSPGSGLLKRNPCISRQPCALINSSCSSVSTPTDTGIVVCPVLGPVFVLGRPPQTRVDRGPDRPRTGGVARDFFGGNTGATSHGDRSASSLVFAIEGEPPALYTRG